MLCPASSFLRSAYFPLFIHLSSSSGLITAAPPLCRRGGDCEFFSVGSLTQNKRGGSRNLVHKQVSFLLRERHGIFFRFCASHAGYSHERSTRGPAQKLRNITKSLGYQKEPWRKAENPPQLNSARYRPLFFPFSRKFISSSCPRQKFANTLRHARQAFFSAPGYAKNVKF